ncbi:hypothetical protein [Aureimonas phyllosphaerae]|uniref:Uncharacterized protein n=1 Tax=Aureimonas phyllosphaerae TaxID=1166078 RepID=A0A7W6FST9_9HYPH|nr:hypothetical protein [Aureimonas phyllosphaerae]MBB3934291.1 hypothetical protein [Aureimonas phyllosphaerae]MBB3958493.1 hypothetical protein [Aureimonas phyllosphaerae]SFE97893.1 hypothetical protein SAMN05216566_101469 [Aureimonas phyllosphaerae]
MSDDFTKGITLIIDEMKSPKARSQMLASFAREEIAITKSKNEAAIGRTIRKPRITVDGRRDAPLGTVKPDGTIVAEFNYETAAVRWILRQLELESPRLTGTYRESHSVYADGRLIQIGSGGDIPDAIEYVLASDVPYATKLDPKDGLPARSKQAPKGVYQAIAAVAATRFDGEADVFFTWRDVPMAKGGSHRNPAIVVRPNGRPGEV